VAQVGCLAVEQEEEEQPVELRVAQPGIGLLVRDSIRARARARVRIKVRVRVRVRAGVRARVRIRVRLF